MFGGIKIITMLFVLLTYFSVTAESKNLVNGLEQGRKHKNNSPKKINIDKLKKKQKNRNSKKTTFDELDMYPSWKVCPLGAPYNSEDSYTFECADCELTFEIEIDEDSYLLHPTNHTGAHPEIELLNATEGVAVPVATSFTLEFRAPDIAAIYKIKTTISFPNETPPVPDIDFDIFVNVFVPDLYDASGAGVIFHNITSHPGNGTYMTEDAGFALTNVVPAYQSFAAIYGVPTGNILVPTSEGASLNYGGLFDINKDFSNPHCRHRLGLDIDIGMSQYKVSAYKDALLMALEDAIIDADYTFPIVGESPGASTSQWAASGFHWHITFN